MKISKRFWTRPIQRIERTLGALARGHGQPVVVSFPKSGRTWVQLMLDHLGIEAEYTHDNADHQYRVPFAQLEPDKKAYRRRNVVFLMRDPRDVVVSGYFQSTKRVGAYEGSIADFIRDERHGIEKIIRFDQAWLAAGPTSTKGFLLATYEDLHKNTLQQLRRIVDFLGRHELSDAALGEAVSSTQFDKLQQLEKSGALREKYGASLTPGNVDDPESYKVRKGKIGGFVEYLDAQDAAYCAEVMRRLGFERQYPLTARSKSAAVAAGRA